uniref:Uncharacterized protein n=1 Tax=Kalanchoe fedtschenkoi TaxID=63787 RepID=A0A7N1A0C9_KALFE
MKCPSVASLWPLDSPIHQKVTATAVLNNPQTLYTGGSDGSIIWWNIDDSNQEIIPVALLCGHAARITSLEVCSPVAHYDSDGLSDKVAISPTTDYGALISASTDGVLCVWSRSSGHCRRRRSLPPSAGIPSVVRVTPWDHRYVCVACHFINADVLQEHQNSDVKGDEYSSGSREQCLSRQTSKCAILVVDTCTLTVVHTIFDGTLSIGLFRFVVVVTTEQENGSHSVVLVDTCGNAQSLPIFLDSQSQPEGEESKGLLAGYDADVTQWTDGSSTEREVVSIATCGPVLGLIFSDCCIFKSVDSGYIFGQICFTDDFFHLGGVSDEPHIVGGMFLDNEMMLGIAPTTCKLQDLKLCVWNSRGLAVVYTLSIRDDQFDFKPLCHIPVIPQHEDLQCRFYINQLNHCLLRVESFSVCSEGESLGIPRVTLWSGDQQEAYDRVFCRPCKIVGVGTLSHTVENAVEGSSIIATLESTSNLPRLASHVTSYSLPDVHKSRLTHNERAVTSSIVVSGSLPTPYAVVYGLYSGDIEVITLGFPIQELDDLSKCPQHELNSSSHLKLLSGHSGAVLCLAAHTKESTSLGQGPQRVLISGGMDCTVRIWNLEAGNLIRVMHHHVASVRQIVLPPLNTPHPWCDCLISLAEDSCAALVSLETRQVERMFHGHYSYPSKVIWNGSKGYVAILCQINAGVADPRDLLFIWDVITGSKDRVLRGAASQAMFDHFCRSLHYGYGTSTVENTSVSSLHSKTVTNGANASVFATDAKKIKEVYAPVEISEASTPSHQSGNLSRVQLFKSCSPYPGITSIIFDFTPLLSCSMLECVGDQFNKHTHIQMEHGRVQPVPSEGSICEPMSGSSVEKDNCVAQIQIGILRIGLSFLHLWDVDQELDAMLVNELKLERVENFHVASGLEGDMGSLTLTFHGVNANLELWKTSSEFSAMRSLTIVSLALFMIALSHSSSASCSTLAAFYTRNLVDKIPAVRPPLLQLLVTFWQDKSEHVRMAARTLFHCAASRAIPAPLCRKSISLKEPNVNIDNVTGDTQHTLLSSEETSTSVIPDQAPGRTTSLLSQVDEPYILNWLESFEVQDWTTCVGGTSQDEMTSRIIVAAALAIWYPSLVKASLAMLVVHPLMKVVMAMNDKYSSTAAELLAEGMESTWKHCIVSEIPNLIEDIFFQIECVNGASGSSSAESVTVSVTFKKTLVEVLLPCVAMADVPGFLTVIESQIWSTSSDSPVHSVSLMTLVRAMRASPRNFVTHLDKVVNYILQTMDPGNLVMRKTCLQSSMAALKEVAHVFPMVAVNETTTRLAVGDAIGNINNAKIQVYDLQSLVKVKVLDASGPPGFPNMLTGASETMLTTAISALSFSPDGEGLVAFSEKGLMIRWWSLGSAWWEKLSRNMTPVQCTKLIFVPPWEGFSANSSRSSIMASVMGQEHQSSSEENSRGFGDTDSIKLLIHNIDLSYRIVWVGERAISLTRHLQELGTFQL